MAKQGTELTIREPEFTLAEIQTLAAKFAKSLFFADAKDEAQALVKIVAGRELGLPPVYSMTKIFFVQGRITLSAEAMGALIKKTNGVYDYQVDTLDNEKCVISFYHNGQVEYVSTFTMKDAEAAELIKEHGNWRKWPRPMLMSKALSQGARIVCPHIISGAYTPEDFGIETDDEGYPAQPQRMTDNASVSLVGEVVDDDAENDRIADAEQAAKTQPGPKPEVRAAMERAVAKHDNSEEFDKIPSATIGEYLPPATQAAQQPAQAGKQAEDSTAKRKTTKVPFDPANIKTLGDLFQVCKDKWNVLPDFIVHDLQKLNPDKVIKSRLDITDPAAAYKQLLADREK